MDMTQLDENVWVAGQIDPADLPALADRGFRSIIGNRPDGEESGQPSWSVIAAAAQDAGIEARHIPIAGPQDIAARKDDFAQALAEMPGPVLAFCRTGTRCTTLWALSQAGEQDNQSILTTAGQAGYDLSKLADRLDQRRGQ